MLLERLGGVRLLRLHRPEQRNAFDDEMHVGLVEVLRSVGSDVDARSVVITGSGTAFSAGGDLGALQRLRDPDERDRLMREAVELVDVALACPLPMIAAVNGPAVGLGCSLALLCDVVFVAESAFFQDPHVSLGVVAGDGGPLIWPFLTSLLRAKEHLLTGDPIPAQRAAEVGLANRMLPDAELLPESLAFAQRFDSLAPQAVQDTKRALNLHVRHIAAQVMQYAATAEGLSFARGEVWENLQRRLDH